MSNFEEKILFAERHFDEKGNIFMDKFVETNNPDCKFIWYKYRFANKEIIYEFHYVLSDYSIWMRVFAYWESTINLTYDVIKNILTVASKEGIW